MSVKGKIPQCKVIAYSALDTGNIRTKDTGNIRYNSEQKFAFTFEEPIFNSRKIRLLFTHMHGKRASQMYMAHFHNPKTKIKAHKWLIVYIFYVKFFH